MQTPLIHPGGHVASPHTAAPAFSRETAPAPPTPPRDGVQLSGPPPTVLVSPQVSTPPPVPVVTAGAPSAIADVPKTLLEELPQPSVWQMLETSNPDLLVSEPDAATVPSTVPRVQLDDAERFVPTNGTTLNTGSTFFVQIPNVGRCVAKREGRNGRSNTRCEVLAAAIDRNMPAVDGVNERIVPRTGLIYVERPFPCHVKDGRGAADGPAGLYSVQAFVDGADDYATASKAPRPDAPPMPGSHPQYLRMAYLDALGDNWDRNPGNWLVKGEGPPQHRAPHCHDNGSLFHTMGGFVEDMGYGWSLKDAGVISPQDERNFLERSLTYAKEAQTALTDTVLANEVDSLRAVPHYKDINFDGALARMRELRDKIPQLIEQRLQALPA